MLAFTTLPAFLIALAAGSHLNASSRPATYLWFEPEWFEGVDGTFGYWSGGTGAGQGTCSAACNHTGSWGVAGPGVSAEMSAGGESEWNSMGVPADNAKAECHRQFVVPRSGTYKIWVRYYDHWNQIEPFRVTITQGAVKTTGELGVLPVVPPNDEFQLYWGFSFGWGSVDGSLAEGNATLSLSVERVGENFRQLDAVLITDDLNWIPYHREKPPFGYISTVGIQPSNAASWRGTFNESQAGASWVRKPAVAGARDYSMWTTVGSDPKWWGNQTQSHSATMTPYDLFFAQSPPGDIRPQFHTQFAGRKDLPIMSWPGLTPGFSLDTPELAPGTAQRQWFDRTKSPFFIMTNYASPTCECPGPYHLPPVLTALLTWR